MSKDTLTDYSSKKSSHLQAEKSIVTLFPVKIPVFQEKTMFFSASV